MTRELCSACGVADPMCKRKNCPCVGENGLTHSETNATASVAGVVASPQTHFEMCLERAARGLCQARGVDPEAMVPYNNGTMAFTKCPAWQLAREELRQAYVIHQFVRTLP